MCYQEINHQLVCDARPLISDGKEFYVDSFAPPAKCYCEPLLPYLGCKEHKCCVRTVTVRKCAAAASEGCKGKIIDVHIYNKSIVRAVESRWVQYKTIFEHLLPDRGIPSFCSESKDRMDALCHAVEAGRDVFTALDLAARVDYCIAQMERVQGVTETRLNSKLKLADERLMAALRTRAGRARQDVKLFSEKYPERKMMMWLKWGLVEDFEPRGKRGAGDRAMWWPRGDGWTCERVIKQAEKAENLLRGDEQRGV